ncbi:MAG: protein kinase [Isosphaeraceae bacterium]
MTGHAQGDSTPRDLAASPDWADWAAEQADRIEMGEPPDLDALDGLPPEEAEELRQLLSTIRRVASFGQGATHDVDNDEPESGLSPRSRMLGEFRLIREVGHGGMGVVYEAEQVGLRRRVALKVLHLTTALDRRHHKRFLIEARAAAALRHRHIVPVHAVGSEHGIPYYVMQFIDGCTLAQVLEQFHGRDGASPSGVYASGTIPPPCCGPAADRPARPPRTSRRPGASRPTSRARRTATRSSSA